MVQACGCCFPVSDDDIQVKTAVVGEEGDAPNLFLEDVTIHPLETRGEQVQDMESLPFLSLHPGVYPTVSQFMSESFIHQSKQSINKHTK